jgi:DNA polymerase-3 subunit gamma/tau
MVGTEALRSTEGARHIQPIRARSEEVVTSTIPHQALYRRWRAQTFSQIVGQEAVVETLRNAVRTDRVSHAVLFVGPRGTGKTSLARILAKAVNCTNLQDGDPCDACESCVAIREGTTLDVLEIDAASNRGINEVRDLRDRLAYPPGHLRRKVYILDEAHQITKDAWNALLKSLEEPPDFVIFMFASTEPSGFPPAILSRLQRYDVRRLTVPEIEGKLSRILEADGRAAEPAALTLIARLAAGGMRDAESILDQLLSTAPETITEGAVRDLLGLADSAAVDGFLGALLTGDAAVGIEILDRLEERGRDPRALLDQIVDAVRARLVASAGPGADGSETAALTATARRLVAIDPDRAGIGGLRLQLELVLFAAPGTDAAPTRSSATSATPAAAVAEPTRQVHAAAPPQAPQRNVERPVVAARVTASGAAVGARPTEPKPEAAIEPAAAEPKAEVDAPPTPPQPEPTAPEPEPAAPQPEPVPTTAASAATTPPPSDGGPDAAPDLTRLVEGWSTVVASVSPATRAVISECRPLAVEGNIVTLGFPETKGFLKDHAERKRPELESALGRFLGREVTVRSVATNLEIPAAADDLVAEARRIFGEDLVDIGEVS